MHIEFRGIHTNGSVGVPYFFYNMEGALVLYFVPAGSFNNSKIQVTVDYSILVFVIFICIKKECDRSDDPFSKRSPRLKNYYYFCVFQIDWCQKKKGSWRYI